MTEGVVHVIEPTLVSEAGHCSIVVQSLCAAGEGLRFTVWVGRGAQISWPQLPDAEIRPYFVRRFRRLQALWLFWRLLRGSGRIVVSTAGRTDLVLLDLASGKPIPPGKVFLYVHQMRFGQGKLDAMRRLAQKQPNVMFLCTTEEIEKEVQGCGFRSTMVVVPLPDQPEQNEERIPSTLFRHVLLAGAARSDKGFREAVELIKHLSIIGASVPVSIQTSGDHYGRYDDSTQRAIDLLKTINYSSLTILPDTLTRLDYVRLFKGAICLQPYDRAEYANKLSGVTLDAFAVGAPVVTLSHTWMARMVEQFGAGVVIDEPTNEALYSALEKVRSNFAYYSAKASQAGLALKKRNQWAAVIEKLKGQTDSA